MIQEAEPLTTDLSLKAEVRLYYDVYTPQREPSPLLLALHGYGSNKGWMMREPRQEGGPLRYGFGWLTNFRPEESVALHHKAVLDLIETLVARGVALREGVFLLGFSQACALNYRFAFTHREVLRGVIGVCGGMPGDWGEGARYGETRASVLHLSGARDEFYPPERVADYGGRLRTRAADVETKTYDVGHEFAPEMRADVRAWL